MKLIFQYCNKFTERIKISHIKIPYNYLTTKNGFHSYLTKQIIAGFNNLKFLEKNLILSNTCLLTYITSFILFNILYFFVLPFK